MCAMYAKVVPMVKINFLTIIEGQVVATVDCDGYDTFAALPDAIEVEGKILGKTGWSSDLHYACYKSGVILGKVIK